MDDLSLADLLAMEDTDQVDQIGEADQIWKKYSKRSKARRPVTFDIKVALTRR